MAELSDTDGSLWSSAFFYFRFLGNALMMGTRNRQGT